MDETTEDQGMRCATDIVVAYLATRSVEPADLPGIIESVRAALSSKLDHRPAMKVEARVPVTGPVEPVAQSQQPVPAVDPNQSITKDFIISLEDGKPYRSLKRHLMAKYGLTPDDYRRKWGLPPNYPMVAPSYSKDRSEVAKRIGLGLSAEVKPFPAPERRKRGPSTKT